jgi:hypothetical protein
MAHETAALPKSTAPILVLFFSSRQPVGQATGTEENMAAEVFKLHAPL